MTDLINNTDLETSNYEFTGSPEPAQGKLFFSLNIMVGFG
jgi:hypothetical protein